VPPRYSYWTIIAGGLPTAFRAAEREELMPTFQRLREKHPDAELKWFARGKLWASPEAARLQRRERGDRGAWGGRERDARDPQGPAGDDRSGSPSHRPGRSRRGEHRGRDWRPGGDHRDPRQPFKDAKKARNQRWREERFKRKQHDANARQDRGPGSSADRRGGRSGRPEKGWKGLPPREKPHGDPLMPRGDRAYQHGQDRRGRSSTPVPDKRGGWSGPPDKKHGARPPRQRPHGDKFWPRGDRPTHHDQERRGRPAGSPPDDWRKNPARDSWRDAPREKPQGDKVAPTPTTRPFSPRERFERGDSGARRSDVRGSAPSRDQGTDEPRTPPRPRGPNRDPRPSENPAPSAPPRPTEPAIRPPGPPERGGLQKKRRNKR
jgi:hypothetical protein